MTDDFFAPPPFDPEAALQRLRTDLRGAGLVERAGVWELRAMPAVRLRIDGPAIHAELVKQLTRSPTWQAHVLSQSAQQREFVALVKKKIQAWSDRDD
ncbi:MAG: hypothetical protein RJA98_2842 [Pseudomonadota bacterium]|jgi:hypothetical protein